MYSVYIIVAGACLLLLTVTLFICYKCYKRRKNRRISRDNRNRPLPPTPASISGGRLQGMHRTQSESNYITPLPRVVAQPSIPISELVENQLVGNEFAPPLPERDIVPYENKDIINKTQSASPVKFVINGNIHQINFIQGEAKNPTRGSGKIRELQSLCDIAPPSLPIRHPKGTDSTAPRTSAITGNANTGSVDVFKVV